MGSRKGDARTSARLALNFALNSNTRLNISGSYTVADQTNISAGYAAVFDETTARSVRATLESDTDFGLLHFSAYQNRLDVNVFTNAFNLPDPGVFSSPLSTVNNELSVFELKDVFKIGTDHTIRLSASYRENSLDTAPFKGGEISYSARSFGGMWQWQLTPDFSLTSAVRQDTLDLARSGFSPANLGLSNADWDRTFQETSFNAGAVWNVNSHNDLRFIVARGVQLPNLFNLGGYLLPLPAGIGFPAGLLAAGVPSLKTTTVTNYEISWDRRVDSLDGIFRLAVFSGESENVVADFGGRNLAANIVDSPTNIGDSRARGIELSLESDSEPGLRWGIGYLYEDVEDSFTPAVPTFLSRKDYEALTPSHLLKINLGWTDGTWALDGFLHYQSAFSGINTVEVIPTAANVLVPISGYSAVDARVAYRFNEKVVLEFTGQNLLHSEQRQTSAALVERRLQATLSYAF